jgi:hypothetical protein
MSMKRVKRVKHVQNVTSLLMNIMGEICLRAKIAVIEIIKINC